MTRNLKALGLALCAVLAIAAVSAQGASADVSHTFKCELTKCFVTGEAHPQAKAQTLAIGEAALQCQEIHLTGTTTTELANELELIPQYSNCSFAGLEVTVTNPGSTKLGETEGGCKFLFGSDTSANTATAGTEDAPVTIACESGKSISIEVFASTNHEAKNSICTISFGSQGPLHGVSYTNVQTEGKKEEVTAHAKVHKVAYTSKGEFCELAGIPAAGENARYEGTATIKAFKDNNGVKEGQVNSTLTTP